MLSTDDTVRRVSYRYRDCNRYPVRKELLEVKHVTYGVRLCKSMETKVLEHSREMGDWVVRQRSYTPGDTISVEVEYTKAGDPIATEVRNAITNYFSSYAVHTCLSQYLDRGFLEVVKLQRRKAYDGRPLPGRNYVFIPKADGEDSYIVESGMIHYVCRPDDNWTVTGFFANSIAFSSTQISRRPNTIRVESLIDGRLVFIDYVMNNFTGAREKLYRDISLLKRMVTNSSFARLPLVFRSYYKSLEMCEQSRQT
ncbi:hypothetical protein BC830DRAFT_869899 [Chytriomyces sp. MP71]|nr:hypothetical protein BC830DRAFT_869899 [Chytriomyces sp. MP71]